MPIKFLSAGLVCLLLLLLWLAIKPVERIISGPVTLGPEWVELRIDPPLNVSKRHQNIALIRPDIVHWGLAPRKDAFIMPDGTPIRPEVELVSTQGEIIRMQEFAVGPGLAFSPETKSNAGETSDLPQAVRFSKIRMRSEQPLHVDGIRWICYTNK